MRTTRFAKPSTHYPRFPAGLKQGQITRSTVEELRALLSHLQRSNAAPFQMPSGGAETIFIAVNGCHIT